MTFDVDAINKTMLAGVLTKIGRERWSAVRAIAEPELRLLAQRLEAVRQMYANGEIDLARAQKLVQMQRTVAQQAIRTIEGFGMQTARDTVNAAARAAGAVVNRLIGFKLIA